MTSFKNWAEQYSTAAPAVQGGMENQGVNLARQRRALLESMIKTNPALAISLSVPVSVRDRLPANVQAELETKVSGQGDLQVLCALPSRLTRIPQQGVFTTVTLNGTVYNAYTYGRRSGQTTKIGVPLHGIAVGSLLALHESPVRELEPGEFQVLNLPAVNLADGAASGVTAVIGDQVYTFASRGQLQEAARQLEEAETGFSPAPKQSAASILQPGTTAAAVPNLGSPWTEGLKNVLIIRVDFSDVPGDPRSRGASPTIYTAAYVKNLADTEVNPYYITSSYGKTSLTNTVTSQLYRMPNPASFYATNFNVDAMHLHARTLASSNYNIASYDRIVVLFSPLENLANSTITFGGLAQLGATNLWVNGEWDFRIYSHELGHTYGLIHGNLWQVTGANPANLGGTSVEYGDDFETQGANFADTPLVDFNPWFKNMLDWIPNTNIITVTSNGTYRVSRFDHSPGTGILALRIPKDGTRNYWVACKRSFTNNTSMNTGAYIFWGYNVNANSDLLDMTTPGVGVQDAALGLSRSFVDTNANITITPVANGIVGGVQYLDVQVLLGPNTNVVTIDADNPQVVENDTGTTNITFNIGLSGPTTSPVTVNYLLSSVTAVVGTDVVATNGTVTFNAGQTNVTVTAQVIGDLEVEVNEYFRLTLTNASINASIFQTGGIGTIIDDDLEGVVDLIVNPNTNALQLVSALINTNSGLIVRGVQLKAHGTGSSLSAGTYQLVGPTTPHTYGLTRPGIVLSSGDVDDYETGPNYINGLTTAFNVPADSAQETLLDKITGGGWDHYDATQLDVYFDVAPGSNNVTFQIVFGSEEYPDFVNSPFVDGFGIFLNGTNIAFENLRPVNINHPSFTPVAGTELNGLLAPGGQAVLTFSTLVVPNSVSNRLTFIVADTTDASLDTTVYISSLAAVEPPPLPIATVFDALPVIEGNSFTNIAFEVRLSLVSTQKVTMSYFAANGSAKRGEDFLNTSGTLTFLPGVTNAFINVPIVGDLYDEPDEGFSVVIFSPTNAYIGRAQAFSSILDDDLQAAKISVADGTITEGDSGTIDFSFTVKLSEPSGHVVKVNYGTAPGTAAVGLDYIPVSGTLAFEPGQTNQTITVKVVGDTIFENSETFFLNISSPVFATIDDNQGQATITDNDVAPAVNVADASVAEGDAGTASLTFNVTLSNPSASAVTVNYATANGTATTADSDYAATSGVLTFTPGEVQASVTVLVNGDLAEEANETFTLSLSGAVNATAGDMSATGTILNDDGPHLSIASVSVREGAAATTTNAVFTVTLIKPDADTVSVEYEVIAGTATAGADYVTTSGSLSFPSGITSREITVVVNGDDGGENNETFTVRLKNVVNGTIANSDATGTIIDDDTIANLTAGLHLPSTNIYVAHPFTVTLTVTNLGTFGATNVVLEHPLPAGFQLLSSTFAAGAGTVSQTGGTVRGVVPFLLVGQSAQLSLQVVGNTAGSTEFVANVSSTQFDEDQSDNSVSLDKELLVPTVAIQSAGSLLVAESLTPANRGLDSGETVTMTFSLRNVGNIGTTNLVAVLRNESGVTTGEPAKVYGSISADGTVVGRDFVFSVQGAGGSTVSAVLDIYDLTGGNTNSLGSITYNYQLAESVTATGGAVTIPAVGQAETYPTTVNIAGLQGRVSKVTVQLAGITHGFPDDLDILLVAPNGKGVVLMSDAGAGLDLVNVNLTITDSATASLPDSAKINSGVYKPTNHGGSDTFPLAPSGPYGTNLASFTGIVPNGDWQLYIVDDGAGDGGSITGWSLIIETTIPADPVAELVVSGIVSPNPSYVGQNFTYTVAVANMGPAAATNLRLTSMLPTGVTFVNGVPAPALVSGSEVRFDLGALAVGNTATVTIEAVSSGAGTPTNIVSVVANEIDLQPGNNTAAIGLRVNRVTTLSPDAGSSSGGNFTLNLAGQPGLTYVIEVSTNLVNWTPIFTNTTLNGAVSFTDTNSIGKGLRFYRALEQ
ncbi:MAG TPA: Calx-beta domain-containing protein [Verrucomicrobiae bacterium]